MTMTYTSFLGKCSTLALASAGIIALTGCANRGPRLEVDSISQVPIAISNDQNSDFSPDEAPEASRTESRVTERWYRGAPSLSLGANDYSFRSETLQLDFIDADVREVVRSVLGEALGETVIIGTGISGRVTLSSPGAVPTSEALDALGQVLRASDLALVRSPSGFLLERSETGPRNQTSPTDFDAGTDILVVRNTQPSSLLSVTNAFAPEEIEARADDSRRIIFLSGPSPQVEDYAETLRRFDLPQLSDRVFGLIDVQFAGVEEISAELTPLLEETLGSAFSVINVIPLTRLNQIFVATATHEQFDQVQSWVERLDRQALGDEPQLYYYVAQNAPATELAEQVSAIYSGIAMPTRDLAVSQPGEAVSTRDRAFAATSSQRLVTSPFGSNRDFSIVPDELNNALIIRATGTEYREIQDILRRMDVLPKQVLIEVTIAEVTLNKDLQFGVRWFFAEGDFSGFFPDPVGVTDGAVNLPAVSPSLSATYIDGLGIGAALNVLETVTDISVISTPSILVQNNQTASLQVGDQIPVVSQQAQSVNAGDAPVLRSIQQRDTGVILQVEPRISGTNSVVLTIDQEVSDSIPTTTSDIDSPTIRQRQFSSTVAVESGTTIVLGGLISDTDNGSRTSIPVLGNLPLLGPLFRDTSTSQLRTELVVFLTPRIIDNPEDHEATIQYFQNRLENVLLLTE